MLTVDLTEEQLWHIRKLLVRDLAELQGIVRSGVFMNYGPVESEQIHQDIRTNSALIGSLPMPAKKVA